MSTPGTGPRISGGGSIAVETGSMLAAGAVLAATERGLDAVIGRAAACVGAMAASPRRSSAEQALVLLHRARQQAERVAEGLRLAALRYGEVEQGIQVGERAVAALVASSLGALVTLQTAVLGPGAGALVVGEAGALLAGAVSIRVVQRTIETGRLSPQTDPLLLRGIALALSSIDDGARGLLLRERPADLLTDDPASPFGREDVGAVLARLLLHPAGGGLSLRRTSEHGVIAPSSLDDLLARRPDGRPQVRIERYEGEGGRRWIVSIAGTVTFAPDSGDEPFDLASDVLGVSHRENDSEDAVLAAMRQAGIGTDEPVLLVGYSQGAIDAARVAQDGGYRVGGVVQAGGPTGQIVLPEDVPVLALVHDQDLVPVLGGTVATGSAGLRRLVVRRALPDDGYGVPVSPATRHFPAHDLANYRRTLALAEAARDPRLTAFERSIAPFVDGRSRGVVTRWSAQRVGPDPVSAGRVPTAAGAADRRPSR